MRATISRLAAQASRTAARKPPPAASPFAEQIAHNAFERPEVNRNVVNLCRIHSFAFSDQLQKLRLPFNGPQNTFELVLKSSRRHCFQGRHERYFDKIEHPMAMYMLDFYIDMETTPLWLSCQAGGGTPFANRAAMRKLKRAMHDALAEFGFQQDGRRVSKDLLRNAQKQSFAVELYGTINVSTYHPTVVAQAKYVDVVNAARDVAKCAIESLARGPDGNYLNEWNMPTKPQGKPRGPRTNSGLRQALRITGSQQRQ